MAGGIKKKDIQVLNNYDTREKDPVSFCPFCLEHGLCELLGPRILKPNEPVPEDYDQWRSCVGCGRTIPLYPPKFASEIEDVIESFDNPYDAGRSVLGNENKKKLTRRQKEIKSLKREADKQKDPEIRAALKRGLDVQIIEDSIIDSVLDV